MKNRMHGRGFAIVPVSIGVAILILLAAGGAYLLVRQNSFLNQGPQETSTTTPSNTPSSTQTQNNVTVTPPVESSKIKNDTDLTFKVGVYKQVTFTLEGAAGTVTWNYQQDPIPGLSFSQPAAPGFACQPGQPCPYTPPKELFLGGRATKAGTYTTVISVRDGAGSQVFRTLTIVVGAADGCPRTTDTSGTPLYDVVTGKFRGLTGIRANGAVVIETPGPAPLTTKTSYLVSAEVYDTLKNTYGGTTISLFSYVTNALSGSNPPYTCVEVGG